MPITLLSALNNSHISVLVLANWLFLGNLDYSALRKSNSYTTERSMILLHLLECKKSLQFDQSRPQLQSVSSQGLCSVSMLG